MAAFPSLEPLQRSYTLGEHVVGSVVGQNGDEVRFLHSDLATGIPLSLDFPDLTLAQVQQIRDHYTGQRGNAREFTLPSSCWLTHSSQVDVVLPGMKWTYAGPIKETLANGNRYNVSVSLLAEF